MSLTFDFQFPFDESLTHVSYVYFLRAFTGDVEETDEMEPSLVRAESNSLRTYVGW